MSPSIASQVLRNLEIARFNSTKSLSFKGLILTRAMVAPSRSTSRISFISSNSSITNGRTKTLLFPSSFAPDAATSTYSSAPVLSSLGRANFSFKCKKKSFIFTPSHRLNIIPFFIPFCSLRLLYAGSFFFFTQHSYINVFIVQSTHPTDYFSEGELLLQLEEVGICLPDLSAPLMILHHR